MSVSFTSATVTSCHYCVFKLFWCHFSHVESWRASRGCKTLCQITSVEYPPWQPLKKEEAGSNSLFLCRDFFWMPPARADVIWWCLPATKPNWLKWSKVTGWSDAAPTLASRQPLTLHLTRDAWKRLSRNGTLTNRVAQTFVSQSSCFLNLYSCDQIMWRRLCLVSMTY